MIESIGSRVTTYAKHSLGEPALFGHDRSEGGLGLRHAPKDFTIGVFRLGEAKA